MEASITLVPSSKSLFLAGLWIIAENKIWGKHKFVLLIHFVHRIYLLPITCKFNIFISVRNMLTTVVSNCSWAIIKSLKSLFFLQTRWSGV